MWMNYSKTHSYANLQRAYLPHGDAMYDGVVLGIGELLDGHDIARVSMTTLEDNPIGAFTDSRQLLITIHRTVLEKQAVKVDYLCVVGICFSRVLEIYHSITGLVKGGQ